MLLPGFIDHSIEVSGIRLNFRTLGPGDMFMLNARAGKGTHEAWRRWVVASSLWMVDGVCLLDNSDSPVLGRELVLSLPQATRDLLFSVALGLFVRQRKATKATLSYCYEYWSRQAWASLGGQPVALSAGVPGAARLGTNAVQRLWNTFNTIEDQRVADQTRWDEVKILVSPHAPKGAKKLYSRDEQAKAEETARRQYVLDTFYWRTQGMIGEDEIGQWSGSNEGGSKKVEDLVEEMRMWVAGERDAHDDVVEGIKEAIVHQHQKERQERSDRIEAMRMAQEEEDEDGLEDATPKGSLAYTADQLAALLRGRPGGHLPGARMVLEGTDISQMTNKYLINKPGAGRLQVAGDKLVATNEGDR